MGKTTQGQNAAVLGRPGSTPAGVTWAVSVGGVSCPALLWCRGGGGVLGASKSVLALLPEITSAFGNIDLTVQPPRLSASAAVFYRVLDFVFFS